MRFLIAVLMAAPLLVADSFTLKSSDLEGQLSMKEVYNSFGCTGQNVSPELHWSHPPEGTKSFGLTMYDPDAPTGSGWWHWVIVNIPATTTALPSGAGDPSKGLLPKAAVQLMTDYGTAGFGGACPPKGDAAHRYVFTLFALDVASLPIDGSTNAPIAGFMLNQHAIAKASIIAYYGR